MGNNQSYIVASNVKRTDSADCTGSKDSSSVVCVNCAKDTQVDVPEDDTATLVKCANEYKLVTACMTKNRSQISSCINEWKLFQQCHESSKK